jgi:hypothetical protein
MTLPASGAISFSDVNTELGLSSTSQISMNDAAVRTLFSQASGAISMTAGYGKSNTSTPGAPTGVSASATGSTSASVSFSAPACNGHLTIDYYQAISSPGCITATGSSPISVTGLSAATAYTFRVRAHNSKGYGCYSGSSNSATTTPAIGSAYGGGYFGGQIIIGSTKYNLVVAPKSTERLTVGWNMSSNSSRYYNNCGSGATSLNCGYSNTSWLACGGGSPCWASSNFQHNLSIHSRARTASIGGYTDWYIPSKWEAEVLYYNLKPTTDPNNGCSYGGGFNGAQYSQYYGNNPYATGSEPANVSYTCSVPTQSSSTDFRYSCGTQYFRGRYYPSSGVPYWTSTQCPDPGCINGTNCGTHGTCGAYYISFTGGLLYPGYKLLSYNARFIRKVAA